MLLAACSTPPPKSSPYRVEPPPRRTDRVATAPTYTGRASWYGQWHHGRITASGETFDMHGMTAAHPTLPLGTRLHVTNVANGRSVEVRVNDRGPFYANRALDLSYAAARALEAVEAGVIAVRFAVLDH